MEDKDIERCNQLIKIEHANWIGISNQLAIKHLLEKLEKKDTLINTMQAEFERLEDLEDNTDILKSELDRLQKENEELKNIISELEQYTLENQISEDSIDFNEFIEVQNMAFDEVYNKIQELLEEGE